jgi:hypothetical protein
VAGPGELLLRAKGLCNGPVFAFGAEWLFMEAS